MTTFNFISPRFIERDVNGKTIRFYAISPFTLGKVRKPLSKLVRAISVVMSGGKEDRGHVVEDFGEGESFAGRRFTQNPINPDLAKIRTEQRAEALEEAVSTLLDDQHRIAVAELIAGSMRDDFERRPKAQDLEDFMEQVDLPTLVELVTGVFASNTKVFGDFGSVGKLLRDRVAEALAPVAETAGQTSNEESSVS